VDILSIIDSIPGLIHRHAASLLLTQAQIETLLDAHKAGLSRACKKLEHDTSKELANTRLDLVLDRPSAFFVEVMHPVYQAVQREYGAGTKNRVIAIMETHLTLAGSQSPFTRMVDMFTTRWEADCDRCLELLKTPAKDIMDRIHQQVQDTFNNNIEGKSGKDFLKALTGWLDSPHGEQKADDIQAEPRKILRRFERAGLL
jgi:hypothetical protein